MIIPTHKPIGASTHQLAQKIGAERGEKATHTGTLDPLASGVVVVLTGDDRFKKQKYANWFKEYEFEILWEVRTDTQDLLGLAEDISDKTLIENLLAFRTQLLTVSKSFVGKQTQVQPIFSAKRIDGESLFDKAKRGEQTQPVTNAIEISDLLLIEVSHLSCQELAKTIKQRINSVTGDFRQEECLQRWDKTLASVPKKSFLVTKHRCSCSKRTYIRGLVRDISAKMDIPATTFSITRTKNGPYTIFSSNICYDDRV